MNITSLVEKVGFEPGVK